MMRNDKIAILNRLITLHKNMHTYTRGQRRFAEKYSILGIYALHQPDRQFWGMAYVVRRLELQQELRDLQEVTDGD